MKILLKWFEKFSLKSNSGKFQFMALGDKACCKHTVVIISKIVQASDDAEQWTKSWLLVNILTTHVVMPNISFMHYYQLGNF